MVERVAVGRIIHGSGNDRVTVEPGERFDTGTLQMSDDDVKRLDATGIIREPRDQTGRATTAGGPGEEEFPPVTEGRSGPAENVTHIPPDAEVEPQHEESEDAPHRRHYRRRGSDADEL